MIKEILTVSLVLFAVIDVVGSIPVLIKIKQDSGKIQELKATLVSGGIMITFLFLGESLLSLIGIDIASFALAGAVIIFIIALEMILEVNLFKGESTTGLSSVVPIAFPLIAGAGTLTTLLSLRADYQLAPIMVGIAINLLIIYLILRFVPKIEKLLGSQGIGLLRRVFGIILLAIGIKIFKTYSTL